MNLKDLAFDGNALPYAMTVRMTRDEALFLAISIGRSTAAEREEVMPGAGEIGSDIYDCLIGGVFNRYWDDGVNEARAQRG